MRREEALEHVLEDLSVTLNEDNERYDVTLTYGSSEPRDDNEVAVNAALAQQAFDSEVEGADELRLLVDDMAQQIERSQIEHRDDPTAFMQERRQAPQLAGLVRMLVEQQYLDAKRTQRYRGLRRTLAYRNDLLMEEDDRKPLTDLSVSRAYVEGLVQVSLAGYARDIDNVKDDDLKEFLVWARERLAVARGTEDVADRDVIAAEIYDYIVQQTDYQAAERRAASADAPVRQLPSVSPDWSSTRYRLSQSYQRVASRVGQWSSNVRTRLGDIFDGDNDDDIENKSWNRVEAFFDWLKGLPVAKQVIKGVTLVLGTVAAAFYKLYKALGLDKLFGWLRRLLKRLMALLPDLFSLPFNGGDDESDDTRDDDDADASSDSSDADGEDVEPEWDEAEEIEDLVIVSDSDESDSVIEQMEAMEDRERAGDWFDIDSDVNYEEASDALQARYEELKNDTLHEVESIHQLQSKRDKRIEAGDKRLKQFRQEVNKLLTDSSLDQEIEDAFRDLTTRDRDVRSRRGRKLDMHAAARRLAGDTSQDKLYRQRQRAEVGRRAVAVAVDFSGSMDMGKANLAIKSLQHATEVVGDDFLAVSFNGGGISLINGPDEDYRDDHLAVASTGGGTPIARGVVGARKLLRDTTQREKVLIVITDGYPNKGLASSDADTPEEDVANEVFKARHDGVKVIGMAAGDDVDNETMAEMFGARNVVRVDMDNLAEQLVNIYEDQMRI